MKKLILFLIVLAITGILTAQTNNSIRHQKGYVKPSTGTYVQPQYKTNSNSTNKDNYSTIANTNTYTGKSCSKAKDYSAEANNYGRGKTVNTGPKGGQSYNNSNGNKTYVPKRM